MNIVYLIGNGFDISKGLPTSYSDFYEYYCALTGCENNDAAKLRVTIGDDNQNWSDLEFSLGKYTLNLKSKDALTAIHKDIITNLRDYLKGIEANYTADNSQKVKLCRDLTFPENYLKPIDSKRLFAYKQNWKSDNCNINVITFNYTNTLERLLGFSKKTSIGLTGQNRDCILNSINHIHGTLDGNNMVLGINDESQFSNEDFRGDRLLRRKYIKSELNAAARTGIDEVCINYINNAHLVCLFGLSFGDTDKRWWKLIGNRLIRGEIFLFIFYNKRDWNLPYLDPADEAEEEDLIVEEFLRKASIPENKYDSLRSKIYVAINSGMFGVDNSKFTYSDDWCNRKKL